MDSKLSNLLSAANDIDQENLSRIIAASLSFLIHPFKDEYMQELGEIAAASSFIVDSPLSVLESGASSLQVKERSIALGLSQTATTTLATTWNSWAGKIASHLVSKVVCKNKLIDMDWTFGVTASSDDCDHVGKTFLQLKLVLEQQNNERRTVFMELTLDQFYQFLASLEKCKSFLNYVSPR
eukprot:scaffold420_cov169-Ochromonas_danica.AAC.15